MADKYFKIPRHSGGPGFISRQSPVNRAHGINNSLVFWLCPLVTGASVLDIAHNIKCTATGDASLNGYTPHGMPAFTFGGSSDNISVPAEMLGRLTNSEATVSMWIKPSSWPGPYTEMFGGRTNASNSERQLNFYGINDTSGHVEIGRAHV